MNDASPGSTRSTALVSVVSRLSLCFTGGAVGAAVQVGILWLIRYGGLPWVSALQVGGGVSGTTAGVNLLWGAFWGVLLAPFLHGARANPLLFGGFVSVFPTLVQWLLVYPIYLQQGFLGLRSGTAVPVVAVFGNLVWAWSAVYWVRFGLNGGAPEPG